MCTLMAANSLAAYDLMLLFTAMGAYSSATADDNRTGEPLNCYRKASIPSVKSCPRIQTLSR